MRDPRTEEDSVSRLLGALAAAVLLVPLAWGAVSEQEAAQLGEALTPLGAEQAGNAQGSIPPWTGGIASAAAAGFPTYQPGTHHPDPYAADQPLFTVTSANLAQYADRLTAGHRGLFGSYPDYRMRVYPTHRSAAVPEAIAQATRRLAASATLVPEGNGVTGGVGGIPFPIPKSGLEVYWNQLLRYRGLAVSRRVAQAALSARGTYRVVSLQEQFYFPYYAPGMTEGGLGNVFGYFLQQITAPANLSGKVLLVQETLDQARQARAAWIYKPWQRRVLRAPQVGLAHPGTNSEGDTGDQYELGDGSAPRYDWALVGKRELYVPYNSYQLQSEKIRYWELLQINHIDQEYARYELHRLWVVEATLKQGASDPCSRRTLYVDEDSWQTLVVDCYDAAGRLARVQERHVINYYEVPTIWTDLELLMDLTTGGYVAHGLQNQEPRPYDFSIRPTAADFQPSALERRDVR